MDQRAEHNVGSDRQGIRGGEHNKRRRGSDCQGVRSMHQEAEHNVGEVERKTLYSRTSLEQCTFLCVIISVHYLTLHFPLSFCSIIWKPISWNRH